MKNHIKKPYQDMVLIDFYERFPDEQACWNHFLSLKMAKWFYLSVVFGNKRMF
jgi:hypothetical protein